MASPQSIQYNLVAETTPGTTPATAVFTRLPHVLGNNLAYTSDTLESPIIQPGGASAGQTYTNFRVEGNLSTHFHRHPAIDLLLESALGGSFAGLVLKSGLTPKSFTAEKQFVEGATKYYSRYKGVQCSSFNLSCEASGNAEAEFEMLGMGAEFVTTAVSGSSYPNATAGKLLNGLDVTDVTVAGITGVFRSLELSVESEREAFDQFGSASAAEVGTGGIRNVGLNLTLYRRNFQPELSLINSAPFVASFKIGAGANGYKVTLPFASTAVPMDEEDGAKMLVTLQLKAGYSVTDGTDIIIEKLA